jgi:hypothetical protein
MIGSMAVSRNFVTRDLLVRKRFQPAEESLAPKAQWLPANSSNRKKVVAFGKEFLSANRELFNRLAK